MIWAWAVGCGLWSQQHGDSSRAGDSSGGTEIECLEASEVDCQTACEHQAAICALDSSCFNGCATLSSLEWCVKYDCEPTLDLLAGVWGCYQTTDTCSAYATCYEACKPPPV